MTPPSLSRRDALKALGVGVPSASVLHLVSAPVALPCARAAGQEKPEYAPKYFTAHQFETLKALCQTIIPPDNRGPDAIEAGAPEFIDLLTSENEEFQCRLGGGLLWLDGTCQKRYYGRTYLECSPTEQREIVESIAYRANAKADASLAPGIHFFAFLRELTVDGYFTSKAGIQDLGYIGNTFVDEFPGCPPLPES